MYMLYIDHVLFPVAPSRIVTEVENGNRVVTLIDGSEATLLGGKGLKKISFDLLLPVSLYPFAMYDGEFKEASYYAGELERIAEENEAVWLDIYRTLPDLNKVYLTNLQVVPEKIVLEENAENGLDMKASVTVREYRVLSAGVTEASGSVSTALREDEMTIPQTYVVQSGDSLWLIAKKYLGSGEKYAYLASINGITKPYTIRVGQVLKLSE
ncbi:MAG: LysM peptidoglycan-binding domain-containing protein [Clostridia bacterium]|nr:LysM peptidoglycan-binding domain-containing protein [Clostridia bacterium]